MKRLLIITTTVGLLFVTGCVGWGTQYCPYCGSKDSFNLNSTGRRFQCFNCKQVFGQAGANCFGIPEPGNTYYQRPVIQPNVSTEMTPAQNMAVIGTSAQHIGATNPNLSYQQRQSLGAIGGLLGVLSQQEAMKEAAKAGKSEVNVNVANTQPAATNSTNETIRNTKQTGQTLVYSLFNTFAKNSELNGIGLLGAYDLNKDGAIDMNIDSKEASIKNTFVNDEKIAIGLWLPPQKMKVRVNQYEIESGTRMLSDDLVKYRDGRTDEGCCLLHYVDVNIIKQAYPNGVQGTKKYELRSYLEDDTQPFAVRQFEVNWDLNAEQVYGK